jgi:phosphoglycolate phosphatase-like HAD superfamily hydrolase
LADLVRADAPVGAGRDRDRCLRRFRHHRRRGVGYDGCASGRWSIECRSGADSRWDATLPAHPEVAESLARLRSAGLRLAALTNSTISVATDQLTHAGLADYFEQIPSPMW